MPSTWKRGSQVEPAAVQLARAATRAAVTSSNAQPPWHRGLDPYFLWAQLSEWRGFKVHAGWDRVEADKQDLQIIAHAQNEKMLKKAFGSGWLAISDVYKRSLPGAMHFTARVNRKHEQKLKVNSLGLRWELALPLRDAERVALGSAMGLAGPTRSEVDFRGPNLVAAEVRTAQPLDHPVTPEGAMAVIDFGCPFLHQQFVAGDVAASRVVALWDQGSDVREYPIKSGMSEVELADMDNARSGWPWQCTQHFNYGRELGPKAIQAMVGASRCTKRMLDERGIYRGVDYLIDYNDPRRRIWHATHGAHVLDVAGGKVDPLRPEAGPERDFASKAKLIFVQLPSLTAGDSSGGALSAHVLDGVRYALDLCPAGKPLAVNISYGSFAGPHDGTSTIERALDELLRLRGKNFAIVLAAGNALQGRCHARRTVQHERSALLRCNLAAGDTTDSFVEIWYPMPSVNASIHVRARSPNRQWSAWVEPGKEDLLLDDARKGAVVAMLRNDRWVPNGDKSLILLAVGPTAAPANIPGALADSGLWEIEIRLVGKDAAQAKPVEVQAWIERDDPGAVAPRVRSFFLDQLIDDEDNTLSSLATGKSTLVAGGFNRDSGRPARYSSKGQQRSGDSPLLLMAACEDDEQEPTISAAAIRSGEVFRMNGTSVAAPVLTRRIFNRMMGGPPVRRAEWPRVLRELVKAQTEEPVVLKEAEPE